MNVGDQIAAEALEWVGTPFHWQGRVKGVGVDCKGLVAGVAKACGRPEADSVEALAGDYSRIVDARRLRSGLARLFDRVSESAPGDVLLLTMGGKAQHLAITLGGGEMVHCCNGGVKPRVMRVALPLAKLDSAWRWRDAEPG